MKYYSIEFFIDDAVIYRSKVMVDSLYPLVTICRHISGIAERGFNANRLVIQEITEAEYR